MQAQTGVCEGKPVRSTMWKIGAPEDRKPLRLGFELGLFGCVASLQRWPVFGLCLLVLWIVRVSFSSLGITGASQHTGMSTGILATSDASALSSLSFAMTGISDGVVGAVLRLGMSLLLAKDAESSKGLLVSGLCLRKELSVVLDLLLLFCSNAIEEIYCIVLCGSPQVEPCIATLRQVMHGGGK